MKPNDAHRLPLPMIVVNKTPKTTKKRKKKIEKSFQVFIFFSLFMDKVRVLGQVPDNLTLDSALNLLTTARDKFIAEKQNKIYKSCFNMEIFNDIE